MRAPAPPVPPAAPSSLRTRVASVAARAAAATAAAAMVLLPAASVVGQMPGVPVLQNGFVRPGVAVAANYATAEGSDVLGAAAAWTPGSARFQLSGGVGALGLDAAGGGDGRRTTGGVRVALPISTPWTRSPASAVGVTGFVGVGGARLAEGSLVHVPLGLGVGYRRAIGETRAVSVFATPFYLYVRQTGVEVPEGSEAELQSSLFRISLGGEVLLTRRIGVTLGYELGSTTSEGRPGPSGGVFGVGAAYAF